MASKRKKGASEKSKDFYENPEVLAEKISKTEEFLSANKGIAMWIGGIIAVAITGFVVFRYYMDNQTQLAQDDMFQAVFYFEQDSLDLALNGDGNNLGFKEIIDTYSGTESANLANYYAGLINLQKSNFNVAILFLEDFSSSDLLVQARAYSLIGDAYMELENYVEAAKNYEKAANYKPNEYFSPIYLKKQAIALEEQQEYLKAMNCYEEIITKYKTSSEVQEAKKEKARLEALAAS